MCFSSLIEYLYQRFFFDFFFLSTAWFEVLLETGVSVLNSTYKIQQIIALQTKLMICMQTK